MKKLLFSFLVPLAFQIVSAQTRNLGNPLILTPLIKQGKLKAAREAAKVELKDFQGVNSYAGYLTVDEKTNSNLFFWFFPSTNNYAKDPVLLWLQGGPGYSSLFGLFHENGPFIVKNDTVSLRKYSWNKFSSVLYIDQPVGTGFSFTDGDYVTNQTQVGDHLYTALIQFFTLFSELQKLPFYVTGISYAGKYAPAIGYTIHQRNPSADLQINLHGLAMGAVLTDPINQVDYGPFLYQLGLIDRKTLNKYNTRTSKIIRYIKQGKYYKATKAMNEIFFWYFDDTGLNNLYNYLKDDDDLDNDVDWANFITKDRVRKALHVGTANFSISNDDVYDTMLPDITKSVAPWLIELLNNYRVLIFNGSLGVIDGYILTVNFLEKLKFSAAAEYLSADRQILRGDDDTVAGYKKIAGNLTDILIRNAGHNVAVDKPKEAFEMIKEFINNR
ncbi:unnamed protein product [Ceutorhynchus assimilis]|uniref:Serine carboxypeptidase n=1 Tax=Ceutorhynchus assimilis TaxID=467358 RepID=A0A9N9MLU1_9CUCU|nr:unnamed protein product [Ceutorhynchus assimilis]